MTDAERIKRIVDNLRVSKAEAEEILQADKAIDRDEAVDFDISDEAHKVAIKMANVKTKKTSNKPKKASPKKINETKSEMILALAEFLKNYSAENVKVENTDRLITFELNGHNYDLTLIQKRKK